MMRLGIVGVGGFARVHLDALYKLEAEGKLEICAAAVRSLERHVETLDHLRSKNVPIYLDYMEMADREKPDIVAVTSGINSHREITVKLLDGGHNVMVEKPPAPHVSDVDAMIAAQKKSGKLCVVGFNWQGGKSIHTVLDRIFSGELGAVNTISGRIMAHRGQKYYHRNTWSGKIKNGEDYIFDGSINNPFAHILNNALIFASPVRGKTAAPAEVCAEMYRAHDIETEDTTSLRIRTADGVEIVFNTTTAAPAGFDKRELDIYCANGRVLWTNNGKVEIFYNDGKAEEYFFDENSGSVHQYNIYKNLVKWFEGDSEAYLYRVEEGRNFTIAINCAFRSSAGITPVPENNIYTMEYNNDIYTGIKDITEIITNCCRERSLFSEYGVPWAKAAETVRPAELANLDYFVD